MLLLRGPDIATEQNERESFASTARASMFRSWSDLNTLEREQHELFTYRAARARAEGYGT